MLNEREIPVVTISHHFRKPGECFFKCFFVVTKENMLFSLVGYQEHNWEAIQILFEWKQSLKVTSNFGQYMCSNILCLMCIICSYFVAFTCKG